MPPPHVCNELAQPAHPADESMLTRDVETMGHSGKKTIASAVHSRRKHKNNEPPIAEKYAVATAFIGTVSE